MFLEHCYRWVTSEGVLVSVVPAPAVGTCARLLTSQFDRLSAYFEWNIRSLSGSTKSVGLAAKESPSTRGA